MMSRVLNISDTESLSDEEDEMQSMQKVAGSGVAVNGSTHIGDNVASSSGTNLRSSFIGMGFSPSLIDKVIKEKGEEDADVLLDALFAYSVHEKSNSESSDSLGPMLDERQSCRTPFGCQAESNLEQDLQATRTMSSDSLDSLVDDKDVEAVTTPADLLPKQELDELDDLGNDNRASLLMMNFTAAEVDFAINKLGKGAPISELVDFITASQIAKSENYDDSPNDNHAEKNEENNTKALFGTMDKTLQLLAMGFNEQEVSMAIEKLGSEVPITELANSICATQMGESCLSSAKNASFSFKAEHPSLDGSWYRIKEMRSRSGDIFSVKTEECGEDYAAQTSSISRRNVNGDIFPKEECYDELNGFMNGFNKLKGKRPKEEFEDDFGSNSPSVWKKKSKIQTIQNDSSPFRENMGDKLEMPNTSSHISGRGSNKALCGPPYFFYGNVVSLSTDEWKKVTQFLYALQPEFVNTQLFSALDRKEGYIHNLPTEDRFRVQSKSPMTLDEAMPHTKKWWPSWDTRKHLTCICSETAGTSQIISHLGKIVRDSNGTPSGEQLKELLYYCRNMNLVWSGRQKLAPIEPEFLERILGYPANHTRNPDMSLAERLESLRSCFQIDTLGYYLSVLKPLFPGGITVLSVYSGIGGAEVTLSRLGIYLKAVVSVESSEKKRKILRRWWQNTDQTGELVQIEDIQKLTTSKLEYLVKKFGAFDLVICQSPCTYAEKGRKVRPGSIDVAGLDFSLYFEFVRVLQRVRTRAGRT